jgi:hypothetical protein
LDQTYLNQIICYIHANPVKAGQCKRLEDWKYSSFREYINGALFIPRKNIIETLEWFDGIENFKETHSQYLLTGSLK